MNDLLSLAVFIFGAGAAVLIMRSVKKTSAPCPEQQDVRIDGETIHQLRGFLTTILWTFEKIAENSASGEQKEIAEHGKNTAETSINLINNTLDAIREGSKGSMKFKMELNDINRLIEDLVSEFALIARDRKLDLKFDREERPVPSFFFDRSQIYLALRDIVFNAVKYTLNGGTITISLSHDDKNVKISIKDTGIGVPKDQIKNLFGKFFRADNAKKIRGDGHGLGLFIAKNIVARHNGKIEVESGEGRGSMFKITLPLSQI